MEKSKFSKIKITIRENSQGWWKKNWKQKIKLDVLKSEKIIGLN